MYGILSALLSDKKGGAIFTCFGLWHIAYIAIILGTTAAALVLLCRARPQTRARAIDAAITLAFSLYIADFFLMPFAYGEIDLEKLPFHACTATCVLCFITRHSHRAERLRTPAALIGLISNLVYLIYPAGVEWHAVHPLSYRALETLLFHGVMVAYGIFVLAFEVERLRWRDCRRELALIVALTLWALLGNTLYNADVGDYSHFFNWLFVVRDPFYLLPKDIAPFIMPPVVVILFTLADLAVYLAYFGIKKLEKERI